MFTGVVWIEKHGGFDRDTNDHDVTVVNNHCSHHLSNIKEEGKDQESIQTCTTPDPRHHMRK